MPPGKPQKLADVLSEIMARRGFARVQAATISAQAWSTAVGEFFAAHSRPGQVKRGVLEVLVANSVVLQELTFRKQQLVIDLTRLLPEEKISDLRFRVGRL